MSHAIAASLKDLDPNNPWVKDSQGRHTNLSAIYDWPDFDSDQEVQQICANMMYL
jgi:ankyrin repeat/IBR domain-containing protein 1